MKNCVHILGEKWSICRVRRSDDEKLENANGYTDWTQKKIVVEKVQPDPDNMGDMETFEKKVMRHEIVHAFLIESGLDGNSMDYNGAWAKCEEMVDWFAFQGPKIYAAWKEAGAI
jgi:hypothetical protein